MRNISNTFGPVGYGETPSENGNTPTSNRSKIAKALIDKANTVPLNRIFAHYNIQIDVAYNITCPFKSHKNGQERSASFKYFQETNSFFCYGCGLGGPWAHGCEFVSKMDGISKENAANKIIHFFGSSINSVSCEDENNISKESLEIMMDFSNTVREFRNNFCDESSLQYIEQVCITYDTMILKRNDNDKTFYNEGLKRVVEHLKSKIKNYQICM